MNIDEAAASWDRAKVSLGPTACFLTVHPIIESSSVGEVGGRSCCMSKQIDRTPGYKISKIIKGCWEKPGQDRGLWMSKTGFHDFAKSENHGNWTCYELD